MGLRASVCANGVRPCGCPRGLKSLARRDVVSHGGSLARPSKTSSAIWSWKRLRKQTATAPLQRVCLGSPSGRCVIRLRNIQRTASTCHHPAAEFARGQAGFSSRGGWTPPTTNEMRELTPCQTAGRLCANPADQRHHGRQHAGSRRSAVVSKFLNRQQAFSPPSPVPTRTATRCYVEPAEVIRRATSGQDQAADAGVLSCPSAFVVRPDI